jgi:hypothetical protein
MQNEKICMASAWQRANSLQFGEYRPVLKQNRPFFQPRLEGAISLTMVSISLVRPVSVGHDKATA